MKFPSCHLFLTNPVQLHTLRCRRGPYAPKSSRCYAKKCLQPPEIWIDMCFTYIVELILAQTGRQLRRGHLASLAQKTKQRSTDWTSSCLSNNDWRHFIHGNHCACIHSCSRECLALCRFNKVSRNIRHKHRDKQTKHLGSAILSTDCNCAQKSRCLQSKTVPTTGHDVLSAKGALDLNRFKKGLSCQKQRETHGERQLLFFYFEKWTWTFLFANCPPRAAFTYTHTFRRGGGTYAQNSTPSPCKTLEWTSQLSSSHVLPIQRGSDSRPTWRKQANLAWTSKQPPTHPTSSCSSKPCTTSVDAIS